MTPKYFISLEVHILSSVELECMSSVNSYQGETVILRVVLFKSYPLKMFLAHHELFTSTSHHDCWLSDVIFVIVALCLYQRTVALNRRVQSQTILSRRRFGFWKGVKLIYCNVYNTGFIIHNHHTQKRTDCRICTLAMAYTCSLTNNRASLLTILMFSTGFLVCSCTVLYTVPNTFFISFR